MSGYRAGWLAGWLAVARGTAGQPLTCIVVLVAHACSEIYMEKVRDLFNPGPDLKVRANLAPSRCHPSTVVKRPRIAHGSVAR